MEDIKRMTRARRKSRKSTRSQKKNMQSDEFSDSLSEEDQDMLFFKESKDLTAELTKGKPKKRKKKRIFDILQLEGSDTVKIQSRVKKAVVLDLEDLYCDLYLCCGSEREYVKAHRAVLVVYSSFFKEILKGQDGFKSSLVYLPDYRPEEIANLLTFLYCGTICLPLEDANLLQAMLTDFGIKGNPDSLPLPMSSSELDSTKGETEEVQEIVKDLMHENAIDTYPKFEPNTEYEYRSRSVGGLSDYGTPPLKKWRRGEPYSSSSKGYEIVPLDYSPPRDYSPPPSGSPAGGCVSTQNGTSSRVYSPLSESVCDYDLLRESLQPSNSPVPAGSPFGASPVPPASSPTEPLLSLPENQLAKGETPLPELLSPISDRISDFGIVGFSSENEEDNATTDLGFGEDFAFRISDEEEENNKISDMSESEWFLSDADEKTTKQRGRVKYSSRSDKPAPRAKRRKHPPPPPGPVIKRKLVTLDVDHGGRKRRHPIDSVPTVPVRIECLVCKQVFRSKLRYETHAATHVGSNVALFFCDYCEGRFIDKTRRNDHELTMHYEHALRKCEECDLLVHKRKFNNHTVSHKMMSKFVCHICGAEMTYTQKFKHMKKHDFPEEEDLTCEFCGKSYLRVEALRSHKIMYHTDEGYKCYRCRLVFDTDEQLQEHNATHKLKQKEKSMEVCSVCMDEVATVGYTSHLKEHAAEMVKNSVEGVLQCPLCRRKFTEESHTVNHMLFHYDKENKYECSKCFYVAKTIELIKVHQKIEHELAKIIETVPRGIISKMNLPQIDRVTKKSWKSRTRNLEVSGSDLGWMCSTCGMLFVTSDDCQSHILAAHSG